MSVVARILEGDFKTGDPDAQMLFEKGRFRFEYPYSHLKKHYVYYDMSDVVELHEISVHTDVDMLRGIGGSALGSMALGEIGALVGAFAFGSKNKVVFGVKFNDGKSVLAETGPRGWHEILKADALCEVRNRWALPSRDSPQNRDEQETNCFLLTAEQERASSLSRNASIAKVMERQSVLAEIIDATSGVELPEHISDHLKWEEFVRDNPNFPWAVPGEDDGPKGVVREADSSTGEPKNFQLTEEQLQACNINNSALRARIVELESLLEKVAAATQGVILPEHTASRLKRVLEGDRTEVGEP